MSRHTAALLDDLDELPYRERMTTLAARARALAAAGRLDGVLADLRAGSTYHRFLAVTAAQVVGDRAGTAAALDDPHAAIRAVAVRVCLRAGWLTADDLHPLLADAPADLRRLVYRSLRSLRRPEVADRLVDAVRDRFGDAEAVALLPACGPDTVRRLLPLLDHALGGGAALAGRHAGVLLDHAEATLPGLDGSERSRWWAARAGALLGTAVGHPERVLTLLERHAPADGLPGDLTRYGVLAAASPARVLTLLTDPARAGWLGRATLPPALLRRLAALPPADLVTLARRLRADDARLAALLDALPPAARGTLYDAALADVETAAAIPSSAVMAVLPRRWREREARRVLTLERVRADEAAVRAWSAELPWPEASAALVPALRAADAGDRATAYELLLTAARRSDDPAAVAEAVARLVGLRNEQDPVRSAALATLATMARPLRADSRPVLATLVTDATHARDASTRTLSALGELACGVLRHHVDEPELLGWALDTLDALLGGHHLPPLGRLDHGLRRGQERVVLDRLLPWITAGTARGEFTPLFAVTRALGRRAWRLPALQELLHRATGPGNVSSVVRNAADLWLADPTPRGERVALLLAADSSVITFEAVWRTVCGRRTDLLDRVLLGPPPRGAFLPAGPRWVPGHPWHVDRWLPRHRRAYVDLQARVVRDAGQPMHARAAALARAARVPDAGRDLVLRYVDSANVTLAEAALGALPWTDRPEDALTTLLAHADDDRARVAMYAAGRAARFVAPSALLARLAGIALGRGRVTSRKEAVRLLGRHGPPEAVPLLRQVWQQPDQHRDVRAAVTSAARQRLHTPQSWAVLDLAVGGGREDTLAVLAAGPHEVPEPHRPRYAGLVVTACRSGDGVVSQAALTRLVQWARWAPDVTDLVVEALTDLDAHAGWPARSMLLGALLDLPHRPERAALDAALRRLVALDAADDDPGGPERDRPARRRIDAILRTVRVWTQRAGVDADLDPARDAARNLARHPGFVAGAAGLLTVLVRLDGRTPQHLVAELTELFELAAGRPALAAQLADALAGRVRRDAAVVDAGLLLAAARELAARGDAAGLPALALTRAGEPYGWSTPWRDLLRTLRGHPVADVRDAALALSMSR
ncbi:hypothetical protein ACH4T9_16230 [Micromonospora sp. NPDC020750]|uniref:hypothetical protein n=1 Tax=unclassified Micromonospora TaxID=2617518 RepID=UPI0037ABCB19